VSNPSDTAPAAKTVDAKSFWRALGERAIGVSVVTAQGADGPAGFLALSATHVSADPPSMLVSIDDRTSALAAVLQGKHFAISYLPAGAQDIADIFGGKSALKGADRFETGRWTTLTTGAPVFQDAIGAIDCVLDETFRYGATTIVVGRIADLKATGSGEPLIYFRGRYLGL
jgi:flavin reductase (DIM6/NTAB) family NADH-FMN oxidoreductase RutF